MARLTTWTLTLALSISLVLIVTDPGIVLLPLSSLKRRGQLSLLEELQTKQLGNKLADKCAQSFFKVYLLPVPGSEWNLSTDKKKENYGVEPTSQPTAYFMSIPVDDEHRDAIQDVDTKVQVHLRVVQRFHDLPDHRLFARQIQIAPLLFTTDWAKQNRKHTIHSSSQREHASAVKTLDTTRAGKVFITGGPGPGISSLAAHLVQAMIARPPVVVAAVQADHSSPDKPDNQSQNDDDSSNVIQADALPDNPVLERNGRIVWTAPQNAQVDDAARRLTHKPVNKIVVRCYPYDQELRAIMEAEHAALELHPVDGSMVRSEQQLICTYNRFQSARSEDQNPAVDQYSLSSFARRLVEKGSDPIP
ncbi:hypothetical protein V8C43DRAFT_324694 [Trichoderma afarasin]